MLARARRGLVPVFNRRRRRPSAWNCSARWVLAGSPARPASRLRSPMRIRPWRKVPLVTTTASQGSTDPSSSSTPVKILVPSCQRRQAAVPCRSFRCSVRSSSRLAAIRYFTLSAWARGPRTATPRLSFRIRKWIPVASMSRPMAPPRASNSRTMWPFPTPPMLGLQLIWPIWSRFIVSRVVAMPIRAAIWAASIPACPPPITTTCFIAILPRPP